MARQYTDREVNLILQRALEPTAEGVSHDVTGHGMTLEQIKEIAAEVGIDADRIDLAAASLMEPAPVPANPYAGIPTTVEFQTSLPGLDLTDVSRHDVLALIRSHLGRQGIAGTEAGSMEWRARDAFGGRYVSLTPSPEGVRVRVLGNYRDALIIFVSVIGVMGLAGASVVLPSAEVGSILALLGGAVAALIPPRFAYRWWRKREDATMAGLHAKLVALLQASAPSEVNDTPAIPPRESTDELPPA